MYLWISGFLKDDTEDDSLKFDLTVKPEHEDAVLKVLGWESLEKSADGDWLLSTDQLQQIAREINDPLPKELDIFIGVRV